MAIFRTAWASGSETAVVTPGITNRGCDEAWKNAHLQDRFHNMNKHMTCQSRKEVFASGGISRGCDCVYVVPGEIKKKTIKRRFARVCKRSFTPLR